MHPHVKKVSDRKSQEKVVLALANVASSTIIEYMSKANNKGKFVENL